MFVSGVPGQAVSREEQHRNVIAAAQKAGVKNVVYTSLTNAKESISILAPDHKATEGLLEASGLNYKILCNNWYLDNQLGNFQEAAANVLVQDFSGQEVYELSGRLLTYADLYQAYKEATGQAVVEVSLFVADYQKALEDAGTPEAVVGFATAIAADIANGALDVESSDLEKLLGHPQASTVEAIKELLA